MPIFDSASLQQAITQSLQEANVPADHHNAFALVATTGGGVKAVLATKINSVWEIDSVVSVAKGKHVDAGISVKATW